MSQIKLKTTRLRCITYLSFASAHVRSNDVKNILEISRARNLSDSVSGVLIFNGAVFVQIIEGPDRKIGSLITRIKNDHRHVELQILMDKPVLDRLFVNWSMGYVDLENGELRGEAAVISGIKRNLPRELRDVLFSMAMTLPI